ncbi:MAG: hypothetical protein DMG41_06210 [Acidobacteria bacterium]|nr:MAG: hypothetical protein DMG42_04495 [Acidobacteriota bacterium]PYT90038.1 MAG: hypothetical protein DMG41_06210 [Acidobacteriota bacterium]
MKQATVGFRAHSGWAAMVAVSVEKGAPTVLARERIELVETFTYRFRQPYHTAEKLPLGEARKFVALVEVEAARLAHRAIHKLQSELERQGIQATSCSLLMASGKTLPNLEKILASHALIHTADGELFREALSSAAKRSGLATVKIRERRLLEIAEQALRTGPAALLRRLGELGRPFGAPWSQDEKFATLAAWLALRGLPTSAQEIP